VEDLAEGSEKDRGLGPLNRDLARLAEMIESGDARPAAALQSGVEQSCRDLGKRLAQWKELQSGALAAANGMLQKKGLAVLPAMNLPEGPGCQE
jgi:hypothetical protein